jgi:DnaJ family protein B protein 12
LSVASGMESNKDEALRCLAIAQRHRDSGNLPSARKFCQKSINLFATPEAQKLLESINNTDSGSSAPEASTSNGNGKPFSSATETHPSAAGAKHRHTASTPNGTAGGSGGEKREYTPEQHAVVKRVRACKVTEYYEILSLKRDCDEGEVKKAYRKVCVKLWMIFCVLKRTQLALALHPDKNGAPNADEAFKSGFDPTISHRGEMKLTLVYSGLQGVSSIIRQVHCQ